MMTPTSPTLLLGRTTTRRRRARRIALWTTAAVLLVAGIGLASRPPDHGPAADAVVTASSTAVGSAARDAVDTGSVGTPGAVWRSDGQTVGAWLDLTWDEPVTIDRVAIVGLPSADLRVAAGMLEFDDGSRIQVPMSTTDRTTSITFSARTVDRLRFTVSMVAPAATAAAVAEIVVFPLGSDSSTGTERVERPSGADADLVPDSVVAGVADDPGRPAADWSLTGAAGGWIELRWNRPVEAVAVRVIGDGDSSATVVRGRLTIGPSGDDPTTTAPTELTVGAVLGDPGRPTTLAFAPVLTRSIRLTVDQVDGSGPVHLTRIAAYSAGSSPPATFSGSAPASTPATSPAEPCDGSAGPPSVAVRLVVKCPRNAAAVDATARLELLSDPHIRQVRVEIWPAETTIAAIPVPPVSTTAPGRATVDLDLAAVPPGPFTVELVPVDSDGPGDPVLFQLVRRPDGPATEVGRDDRSPGFVNGRTLVYAEDFDRPLTFSRDGAAADYASAKPTDTGPAAFGDAIFPWQADRTLRVADGRLELMVEPTVPGETDPSGWGRHHVGALLSSARVGGSGFAAQYGYFEARMLAPASPGTWPAWWMLPSDNLLAPTPVVAEVDAVELYGHAPTGSCHTTKRYPALDDGVVPDCGPRFASARDAVAWHTWGADVTPAGVTFYLDGTPISANPRVDGLSAPMFFLVNLQLGGGWPVDLSATSQRASLWVDRIRVWV